MKRLKNMIWRLLHYRLRRRNRLVTGMILYRMFRHLDERKGQEKEISAESAHKGRMDTRRRTISMADSAN